LRNPEGKGAEGGPRQRVGKVTSIKLQRSRQAGKSHAEKRSKNQKKGLRIAMLSLRTDIWGDFTRRGKRKRFPLASNGVKTDWV